MHPDLSPALDQALALLERWAVSAEEDWSTIPGHPEFGCYGTGYNGWGVQTVQKYVAALASVAHFSRDPDLRDFALGRTLAALRFNLASHKSGPFHCTDGAKWGHTWISALGTERMMFAVDLLRPHLTPEDLAALRAVLCSEADWLLTDYARGKERGISAGLWNHEGHNDPESNVWNGAHLWRAATLYPDHPHAEQWRQRAHRFLINGVSVATDAHDSTIKAGLPVSERHIGPNFFPNYALDHHGYLNVGYMAICASNAAFLHFDLKTTGLPVPETLDHHQRDLWAVLRRFILSDGRLARVGGDTRVRYAYCQEYLLPSLLYAADHLGEPHAVQLIQNQLHFIQKEADANRDGSFFSHRLATLREQSPQYFTRLESDRACVLGMLLAWHSQVKWPEPSAESFETSVAGSWTEPEHGAALHRSPSRFASFSWRAFLLAQGLCLPPDDGHLAEWEYNLAGRVSFVHHPHPLQPVKRAQRTLLRHEVIPFSGGFLTYGAVMEGVNVEMAEGWSAPASAVHQIVYAVLPDDHTVLGLQFCRMGDHRGYVAEVKGLHLNLPNDLFNDFHRTVASGQGDFSLEAFSESTVLSLGSPWANVEDRLGIVGLYGDSQLHVSRTPHRRDAMQSLQVEQLCYPLKKGPFRVEADETILDCGWAALSAATADQTHSFATHTKTYYPEAEGLRQIQVQGMDGKTYLLAANFSDHPAKLTLPPAAVWYSVTPEAPALASLEIFPGHACLFVASH